MKTLQAFLIFALTSVSFAQTDDLAAFEREATMCKELGATHMSVTDDLPPALWQFDSPDDPYPAWYVYRPGLLKIFPPKEVQPFVNTEYANKIVSMIEARCRILRKLGMKGHFNTTEPQVLPEAFFTAYPNLRGPRVDQPNRARIARFSPCVDQPETIRLYREAMKALITKCPEIDSLGFLTQDSGSGFCWVPALYPGINGHSDCKNRPMEERISGFLIAIQQAAKEAGNDITINVNPITPRQWMIPSFAPQVLNAVVAKLPRGVGLQGREGPDGRPFTGGPAGGAGTGRARNAFYPVVGIVVPNMTRGGRGGRGGLVNLGDATSIDFSYRMLKSTRGAQPRNMIERLTNVRAFAVSEVGEEQADNLMEAWNSLDQASGNLDALNFGAMLQFGHVLNRWIVRPMVPFPSEMSWDEKKHYRRFLFQAKDEDQANNLIDIQAMRMFEGWGAKMLFQRVIETTVPQMRSAQNRIERVRDVAKDENSRKHWDLVAKRIEAATCLLHSADHMVSYQAHLDRVKQLGIKPEANPPLGVQNDWARADMMELARKEIDNMVRLRQIITSTSEPILETAATSEYETIMRLGPDTADQIKRKIDVMNAHWRDYDRIFSPPNP